MADQRRLAFAIPGDINQATGGYGYDRRMIAELRAAGWRVDHVPLAASYPLPADADRAETARILGTLDPGVPLLVDGLAFAVMDDIAPILAAARPLVALVHHPLALETGIDPARAARFDASEKAALSHVRHTIVTSAATARTLVDAFGVNPGRLTVAVPGTDRTNFSQGSGGPTVRILAVGTLVPRKGHLDLIEALATLADQPWHLTIVGDKTADAEHASRIAASIARYELRDRVTLADAWTRADLEAGYASADIFALASHYEGYGMAYAEAVAHGLPVAGTTGGAIADTVGDAGELVRPGDVAALASVLSRLIQDPEHRARRAEIARAASVRYPTWKETAAIVATVIEDLQ